MVIPIIMLASFRIRTPAIYDNRRGVENGMNTLLAKFKKEWHLFRVNYHELLLADCLDYELQCKLEQKITYHKMRLNSYC
ncbi:hypothetical protein [Neobacillus sp. GCM10023253]|uniref:hypothetical protein n=1 Tax=Neobacillus sp. GCM10023253 TaxID=3252644 RepID=UPI00366C2765